MNWRNVIIAEHSIEGIEMIDKNTCLMGLLGWYVSNEDETVIERVEIEYWFDDKSWHFTDILETEAGEYEEDFEDEVLTYDDKRKCKEVIRDWLKEEMNIEIEID